MADIIYLNTMRPLSPEARGDIGRRRKALAVQKVFHCTRCHMRCEKCGDQIDVNAQESGQHPRIRVPYRFCASCNEEYIDYLERLKGAGDTECYWRNESWLESWQRWIDYRSAVDRFIRTSEFARLLRDLKENKP